MCLSAVCLEHAAVVPAAPRLRPVGQKSLVDDADVDFLPLSLALTPLPLFVSTEDFDDQITDDEDFAGSSVAKRIKTTESQRRWRARSAYAIVLLPATRPIVCLSVAFVVLSCALSSALFVSRRLFFSSLFVSSRLFSHLTLIQCCAVSIHYVRREGRSCEEVHESSRAEATGCHKQAW